MEMTRNLKTYLKLYKMSQEEDDVDEQDSLIAKMEELYYELNEDEIAYLEEKQIV